MEPDRIWYDVDTHVLRYVPFHRWYWLTGRRVRSLLDHLYNPLLGFVSTVEAMGSGAMPFQSRCKDNLGQLNFANLPVRLPLQI